MTHRGQRGLDAPPIPVALCLMVGVTVCLAWAFDLPIIREVIPGRPAMQLTTAICFIAAGAMLYFTDRVNGRGVRVRLSSAALILLVMGWTWTGYVFSFDPHLDEAIGAGDRWPGRPSFGTAFAFTAAALWGMLYRTGYAISELTAGMIVVMIAIPAIIGHAIGNPTLYYEAVGGVGMPLNTAILLLILGAAIHGRERGSRGVNTGATLLIMAAAAAGLLAATSAKIAGVAGPSAFPIIDTGKQNLRGR